MQVTAPADIIEKTREYVRAEMSKDSSGHDWWHVHRVTTLAIKLAKQCGAEADIVELAALLHDIGDYKLRGPSDEPESAIARRWLEKNNLDAASINHICEIIDNMSFKGGLGSHMWTLEGHVVQDADRLEAIGAIGIARAFAYGGHKNRIMHDPEQPPAKYETVEQYRNNQSTTINHFYEKLLLLKDLLNTEPARKIAEQRHQFMVDYLAQFEREWRGEV